MVRGPHSGGPVPQARRLDALRVPEERGHPRLVVRDPVVDESVETVEHELRVLRVALDDVTVRPPALVLKSLRIHGGVGYTTELPIERYYRDAPLMIIGEGTNEIQRLVIARGLLQRYAID